LNIINIFYWSLWS